MSTRIGCDNFHYVAMTTEETPTAAPVYGTVTAAPGVMSVNINPNASQETLFADDGPFETATTLGNLDVEVQKAYLTTADKAAMLGKTIDGKGALVSTGADVPPWMAIAFRTLKANGKYRYVWLYKGKFQDPEDNNETKGDSISWQNDTINAQFVAMTYGVTIGGKTLRPWKYEIDEEDSAADPATIAAWFTAPPMPAAASGP